jgi:hypothetical protein
MSNSSARTSFMSRSQTQRRLSMQEARMFNRRNSERRGSPHFLVGVLAGAAAVGAYALSCDATSPATSGTTGTPTAANEVPYANAQSGLAATTVQAAIDEIGTTMRSAIAGAGVVTGGPAKTTTWAIRLDVVDVAAEEMTSTSMGTVTLTETAAGRGSYQTSGNNVLIKDGIFEQPTAKHTGKYFVVGDVVVITGERTPGTKSGQIWFARLADGGHTLTLNDGTVFVVLTKQ